VAELRALIADDEAALRDDLRRRLGALWPELRVCAEAENGLRALELVDQLRPDVAFLDIRMPGLSGIEVARRIAGTCRVVFVTAYDQYAVQAFESEAADYLLKPIEDDRLAVTVSRLQRAFAREGEPQPDLAALVERVALALGSAGRAEPLRWIRASQGERVRIVPVEDVCYFQARDKYTAVVCDEGELLIRTPIKELEESLDPDRFWRVHRNAIVNAHRIEAVSRYLGGRLSLRLRGRPETLVVSRQYAQLFRQM